MANREVVVLDAVRTPIGKFNSALAHLRPDDLAAATPASLLERHSFDPATVDEVVLGAANQSGEDNRNVARITATAAHGVDPDVFGEGPVVAARARALRGPSRTS